MARHIVILTGSGISAESGIATFRDTDGVWSRYDYREVATPEGFASNPDLVHAFYNQRRSALSSVEPNAAHVALAELESGFVRLGASVTVVTQNVDDLHERAGSVNVLHMHGELLRAMCQICGDDFPWSEDLATDLECPACEQSGGLRPFVVWFGEMPRFLDRIAGALEQADLFVSIGTSGSVYPAAGFVADARSIGVPAMELNLEPSENAHLFTGSRYGPATEIVPAWVRQVLAAA